MLHQTITVQLPNNAYPIYIGKDLLSLRELMLSHLHGHQVLIVTQNNIAQHYLATLKNHFSHLQCNEVYLAEGEQAKNIHEWQAILEKLLYFGHERTTTIVALGGGVVGDVAGFAAACYQRGVNYIQIPTTLIAQVDSAIGGKTAINHPHGKNMIGAFHQPQCVIADIHLLNTLPQREFFSGLAEVIKYGLIYDADFFNWLEKNSDALIARDSSALLYAISRSAAIKSHIVSQDEKEAGMRSLLNFGHTFGHAIETAYSYQTILHGEAVAWGMMMASELSHSLGWISADTVSRVFQLLKTCHLLEVALPFAPEQLLQFMMRDKKVKSGKLNLILLKKIGEAVKVNTIDQAVIIQAICCHASML